MIDVPTDQQEVRFDKQASMDFGQAIRYLDKALEIDPNNKFALTLKGDAKRIHVKKFTEIAPCMLINRFNTFHSQIS